MSDTTSIAIAQRAFWNSEATRRWVTEQTRIDRLMANVTEAALTAAAPKSGESVLDIGCGTGTTALRLADAVRPSGQVLGVDISEQQLGLARQRVTSPVSGVSSGTSLSYWPTSSGTKARWCTTPPGGDAANRSRPPSSRVRSTRSWPSG
jgi:predicted RNA methylase